MACAAQRRRLLPRRWVLRRAARQRASRRSNCGENAATGARRLEERLNRGLTNDRLIANLTSAFGGVALLLACLGLYGTIAYGVARRIAELGLRMALGANRTRILWLVVREALMLVASGAVVGLPLAYAAGRGVRSLLHGVDALDPTSYWLATILLLAVASVAAYLPAHRASRIDPMVALRLE